MADPFDAEIGKIEPTTDVLKLDLRVGDEMDLEWMDNSLAQERSGTSR